MPTFSNMDPLLQITDVNLRETIQEILVMDAKKDEKLNFIMELGLEERIVLQIEKHFFGQKIPSELLTDEKFLAFFPEPKRKLYKRFLDGSNFALLEKYAIEAGPAAVEALNLIKESKNESKQNLKETSRNQVSILNSPDKQSSQFDSYNSRTMENNMLDLSQMELSSSEDEELTDEEIDDEDEIEGSNWTPPIKDKEFFDRFPNYFNILVLGETGVGKSTFVNGLVNYLKYNNLHEAKKGGVEILIKSSFVLVDEDYNKTTVKCNPTIENGEENEDLKDGQSSTQNPKAYQFSWGPPELKKFIRIIDTPGVGDVRGIEQERMNFQNILSFIADYKELHAICILMKPNESKLTLTFRYCINELLCHLHKSASRNIIFCFTNARGTLYKAGDTYPTLKEHLNQLYNKQGIRIPLENSTMFYFDNESFRFLCAWKQGIQFNKETIKNFNSSWQVTVTETFRMFEQIALLPTHLVQDTLSVNNIRKVVMAMARPLAEIARVQMLNAQRIEEKLVEVEKLVASGKAEEAKLYVDQVKIVAKELSYPVTVCTAERCVELMKFSDSPNAPWETVYKTKCHPHCGLSGVQTGICPNTQIQGCACFGGNINRCTVCACDWTTHLHIRYELEKSKERIVVPEVKDSMFQRENAVKQANIFVNAENLRKKQLENESNTIRDYSIQFAAFLKDNSIIPYNDVYKEYIEHLIKEEKGKVNQGGSSMMMKQLQKYRDEYIKQKDIIKTSGATKSNKTIDQIYAMIEELKRLPNCGTILQDIQRIEMLSVRNEQKERILHVNTKSSWYNATKNVPKKKNKMKKHGGKGGNSGVKGKQSYF